MPLSSRPTPLPFVTRTKPTADIIKAIETTVPPGSVFTPAQRRAISAQVSPLVKENLALKKALKKATFKKA